MAKLVVLSEALAGRSYELKVEKTSIGRLEDNAFQISEGSVSSYHCEVLLRGNDVVIKDLNSTNGTFINGKQVSGEGILKAGQILRLGQIELRLEDPNAKVTPEKKKLDKAAVVPQGVRLGDSDQGKTVMFDKNSPFAKKSNKGTKVFIACAIAVGVLIVGVIAYALFNVG